MRVLEALRNIREIHIPDGAPPVIAAVIEELRTAVGSPVIKKGLRQPARKERGLFFIGPFMSDDGPSTSRARNPIQPETILLELDAHGSGRLCYSVVYHIYGFTRYLLEHLADKVLQPFIEGRTFTPTFRWQRIVYDFFLTQEGRIQRDLHPETYVRAAAGFGFTHLEVNGLAAPGSPETGPEGEAYPMFYTYCPALDQFVSSTLNHGLYPRPVLRANLDNLKRNAGLALRYGLVPVLLCFEPRSVPERFFKNYPMLRGARVDHPFRSFKPRYNMTIAHPAVLDHYAQMVRNLLREVPELGALSVWTNDSGAGFEHTKSLYVGRNGGPYLIREWKDDEEIAAAAGENALRFLRTLRNAGREINPDFRILTRLESFYGEHETMWSGLEEGFDVETSSLASKGWESVYTHPRYPDSGIIQPGTVYQSGFDPREKRYLKDLRKKKAEAHFYFSAGPHTLFAPLIGIPYPTLTYRRLKELRDHGIRFLAHTGGTFPPELVPYNVNHEIMIRYQFESNLDISVCVMDLARKWSKSICSGMNGEDKTEAGAETADILVEAWRLTEEAILAFPIVTSLYVTFGFTWYRLWLRPLVPDIEALKEEERAYYERYMCTTPHNPNNVDLSRDVLFQLATPEWCARCVERMDAHCFPPIDRAVNLLNTSAPPDLPDSGMPGIFDDQSVRLRALRCWLMTQRNVAGWIAGVYRYLNATEPLRKQTARELLRTSIVQEMENTRALMSLLDTDIAFMATTDMEETPLIHRHNLRPLLERRLTLMNTHIDDEPRIDPDYMIHRAAEKIGF